MTNPKCREVLDRYEQTLLPNYSGVVKDAHAAHMTHLRTMIPTMREMLDQIEALTNADEPMDYQPLIDMREKFMRWLGFMQGVLFAEGVYTVDELKMHNRAEEG